MTVAERPYYPPGEMAAPAATLSELAPEYKSFRGAVSADREAQVGSGARVTIHTPTGARFNTYILSP